jgi:opacity protein-like surface antigen
MKKIINSTVVSILLTTSLWGVDMYVGLEKPLSYKVKNTVEVSGYGSLSNSESPSIFSFKLGGIISGKNKTGDRVEFLYNFGDKSANPVGGLEGEDVISLNLNYNWTIPSITPIDELLPYVRVGGTYIISDEKYYDVANNENYNYKAVGLTLGLGTYYQVTDKINVSLGFDYGYRLWDDLVYGYAEVE